MKHEGTHRVAGKILFGLAALALLALVAVERFQYIDEIGMWGWNDPEEYYYNAVHFPTLGKAPYFRVQPAAHLVHAVFIKAFRDTDYTLKLANGVFDVAACAVLLVLATRVAKNRWVALVLVALYAFAPQVVFMARSELPHSIAAFWGLTAFWAFWKYWNAGNTRRGLYYLVLSGCLTGFACMTHLSMCGLVFAYLAAVCLKNITSKDTAVPYRSAMQEGFLLSAACGAVIIAFISIMPMTDLIAYLHRVYGALVTSDVSSTWKISTENQLNHLGYSFDRLEGSILLLLVGTRWIASLCADPITRIEPAWSTAALIIPATAIFAMLAQRLKRPATGMGHVLILLSLSFVIWTASLCGTFTIADSRYIISIFPLILLALAWWGSELAGHCLPSKYAAIALGGFLLIIYAFQPHVYPYEVALRQPLSVGKEIHNFIGQNVNADNRLLILPYAVPVEAEAWLTDYHLFGTNAVHVRSLEYTGEDLTGMSRRHRIRYVYVSKYVGDCRRWAGSRDERLPIVVPSPDFYGSDICHLNGEALNDWCTQERRLIDDFLKSRNSKPIQSLTYGTLYELRAD